MVGPVSKNLYTAYDLYTGTKDHFGIKKIDTSDNIVWNKGYELYSAIKSSNIDSNELNIYLETYDTDLSVIKLSVNDGSIVNQVKL